MKNLLKSYWYGSKKKILPEDLDASSEEVLYGPRKKLSPGDLATKYDRALWGPENNLSPEDLATKYEDHKAYFQKGTFDREVIRTHEPKTPRNSSTRTRTQGPSFKGRLIECVEDPVNPGKCLPKGRLPSSYNVKGTKINVPGPSSKGTQIECKKDPLRPRKCLPPGRRYPYNVKGTQINVPGPSSKGTQIGCVEDPVNPRKCLPKGRLPSPYNVKGTQINVPGPSSSGRQIGWDYKGNTSLAIPKDYISHRIDLNEPSIIPPVFSLGKLYGRATQNSKDMKQRVKNASTFKLHGNNRTNNNRADIWNQGRIYSYNCDGPGPDDCIRVDGSEGQYKSLRECQSVCGFRDEPVDSNSNNNNNVYDEEYNINKNNKRNIKGSNIIKIPYRQIKITKQKPISKYNNKLYNNKSKLNNRKSYINPINNRPRNNRSRKVNNRDKEKLDRLIDNKVASLEQYIEGGRNELIMLTEDITKRMKQGNLSADEIITRVSHICDIDIDIFIVDFILQKLDRLKNDTRSSDIKLQLYYSQYSFNIDKLIDKFRAGTLKSYVDKKQRECSEEIKSIISSIVKSKSSSFPINSVIQRMNWKAMQQGTNSASNRLHYKRRLNKARSNGKKKSNKTFNKIRKNSEIRSKKIKNNQKKRKSNIRNRLEKNKTRVRNTLKLKLKLNLKKNDLDNMFKKLNSLRTELGETRGDPVRLSRILNDIKKLEYKINSYNNKKYN